MNLLTRKLLDSSLDGLHRKAVVDQLPPVYAESYGELLLERPLLVGEGEVTRFAADLTALLELLTSLPQRGFGGSRRRYGEALGVDAALLRLMTTGADGPVPRYARADAYHDGEGFRLLELNVGSELGGVDSGQLNRAFLGVEPFRSFAERQALGYVDTAAHLATSLRRAGAAVGAGEPVVALIEGRDGLAAHAHVFAAIQEALRRHGVTLLLGEIHQLGNRNGKLTLAGTPLDVVLRYFAADQLTGHPADTAQLELVMRAHAEGRTALFTPLAGSLFASKGSLGMLHEPRVRELLTAPERAVVDRVVPWTRVLTGAAGAQPELLDYCRAHRGSLVLKPGVGYGATGVVVGREVSDQDWQEHLQRARDHVVQRVVVPAPEPVRDPETGEVADWRANWGVFVTESGYGGAFVRALRAADGSVISYSNPGTRGTCVFTYPEHDAVT